MAEGYVDENGLMRWGEEQHFEELASPLPREQDEDDDDEGDDGDEEGEGDDD